MLNRLPAIFCALGLILSAAIVHADDWYRFRGPDLNGISRETGWQTQWPQEGPKRLWKVSVGTGFSSVTVSHGRLYTMGNDGVKTDTVYCLDAVTGAEIWKHSYPCILDPNLYEGGPNATPTVDDDRVYSFSRKGDLFCFDAAKGTVLWSTNVHDGLGDQIPTWGFSGSALVDGNLLILNVGSAGTAFDKKTGKLVWASAKTPSGYATPVVFDTVGKHQLAIMSSQKLEAVNPADGKSIWSFPWKTSYDINAATPVIDGDKIFVSSGYGHGSALLDISSGKPVQVWENKTFRNHFATSVLWQGFLYGTDDLSSSKFELKCLDWKTGETKWHEPSFGKGNLMMAGGKIVGLSDKGLLMIIDPSPDGFKLIVQAQVLGGRCWTAPVLANGRIYCRNARGDLVCLDVSAKP